MINHERDSQGPHPRRRPLGLRDRLSSAGYALKGIAVLVRTQPNAWIELTASVGVVTGGLGFGISAVEWCLVALSISLVWAAEAINTAFEFLADTAVPHRHPMIGHAKDAAAAGVLLAVLGALAVGLIVFGPRFQALAAGLFAC